MNRRDAQLLVEMPLNEGFDQRLTTLAIHAPLKLDRVAMAATRFASLAKLFRDISGAPGGALPHVLERIYAEAEEARYTLAEALGMTEPDVAPAPDELYRQAVAAKPVPHDFVRVENPRMIGCCGSCGLAGDHRVHGSTNQEVSPS